MNAGTAFAEELLGFVKKGGNHQNDESHQHAGEENEYIRHGRSRTPFLEKLRTEPRAARFRFTCTRSSDQFSGEVTRIFSWSFAMAVLDAWVSNSWYSPEQIFRARNLDHDGGYLNTGR